MKKKQDVKMEEFIDQMKPDWVKPLCFGSKEYALFSRICLNCKFKNRCRKTLEKLKWKKKQKRGS